MELKDLVGEHELSGLDTFIKTAESSYADDGEGYRFVLDGITYCAIENPDDGYRSMLRELEVTTDEVVNTFPPQKVYCKMMEDELYSVNDVLEFYDAVNNELVLEIGTKNTDDYYPYCVMGWYPQNLSANKNVV